MRAAWIGVAVLLPLAVFALRPTCVPLSAGDLARFEPPIETRTDQDFYLQVFQQMDGHWCQSKTWPSRQRFFGLAAAADLDPRVAGAAAGGADRGGASRVTAC